MKLLSLLLVAVLALLPLVHAAGLPNGALPGGSINAGGSPVGSLQCSSSNANNLAIQITAPGCTTVTTQAHQNLPNTGFEAQLYFSQIAGTTVTVCLDFPAGQVFQLAFYDNTGFRRVENTQINDAFVQSINQPGGPGVWFVDLETDSNVYPPFPTGCSYGPPAPSPSPLPPPPPIPPPPPPQGGNTCTSCNFVPQVSLTWSVAIQSGTLVDSSTGRRLLGVARPSLEWNPCGQYLTQYDYQIMSAGSDPSNWGAKIVRLALNQDYWLTGASLFSPTYKCWVWQQVQWAHQAGLAVILDLHRSDCGNLGAGQYNNCQQPMADVNSLTFWIEVAAMFKDDPAVLFELYNEPMQIPWNVWLNGGSVQSSGGCCTSNTFQAVGMQQLYNAVRGQGANNIILIGGINWAFDLSGVGNGFAVQGYNIVYVTHPYDYGGKQPADFNNAFGYLIGQGQAVFATEFGQMCQNDGYVAAFLNYAETIHMGWTAWGWFVSGCNFPSIITDWSGTPDSTVGFPVKLQTKNQ